MNRPWRRRPPSREAQKAAARRAKIQEPKRRFKRTPPLQRLKSPGWRERWFSIVVYLAAVGLLCWALTDLIGPAGWKLGLALAAFAVGGIEPLWVIISGGLAAFPPWDWFRPPTEGSE